MTSARSPPVRFPVAAALAVVLVSLLALTALAGIVPSPAAPGGRSPVGVAEAFVAAPAPSGTGSPSFPSSSMSAPVAPALSGSSAGSVVATAYVNYNATLPGNFASSVFDWNAGASAVDPVTDQLWIPESPITVDHIPAPVAAPALVYSSASNSTQLVSNLTNTSAIAYDPVTGDLYATAPFDHSVVVFDPATERPVGAPIPVGVDPTAILYDPASGNLYVANGGSGTVTVINGTTNAVEFAAVPAGVDPIALADDPVDHLLFVADSGAYAGFYNVSAVSTTNNTLDPTHISLPAPASTLAYTPVGNLLAIGVPKSTDVSIYYATPPQPFAGIAVTGYNVSSIVSNANGTEFVAANGTAAHLIIVPASTGVISPSFLAVRDAPARVTLDPTNGLVYAWSGVNRTITTVNLTTNSVQQTSPDLGARAATLTYDPTTGHIFVADQMTDSISVLNATTLTTARDPVLLPDAPTSLVDDPQLSVIYAAYSGGVVAISARSGAILAENTALPGNNTQLIVDAASGLLWDVNGASGLLALEIPSLAAGPVAGITSGAALVRGVVLDPGTNDLFVVNTANSTVAVVNGSTGLEVGPAISGIPGVISVAYDAADQSVYALGRSISILDPRTMAIVGAPIAIAANARAWSIIYDPSRHNLYVTSNGTPAPPWPGTVSVIDGSSIAASEAGSYVAIAVGQLALDLLPVQLPGSVAPGSSEILVANFDSGTVSIIASPPTIAYFAANPNPVDAGVGTDLLLGFTGGAGPSRISYTSLPPGCTSSDVTALRCTTDIAGSYRIYVTVTSAFGLSSSAATVLSVSPSLHVGMNFGSPGAQVDLGHLLDASATVSGGTGPFNYSWMFGDAGVGWGQYVGHAYAAAGTYLVTLTVLDASGGVSSTTSTVSVVSLPAVSISASPSNVTDVNRSIGFSAAVSGGTTPGNASWTFGDGGTANGTVVDHAYAVPGVYFASVHYRDASGVNASQYTTVVVNPALAATLTVTSTPAHAPIAVGTPIDFTTAISGGTAPYTIVWGFYDGSYGYGVSSAHTYGAAGTYTVTLFIEDAAGAQWNSTYRLVVASAPVSSSFGTDFQAGLLLGLLVGAVAAAGILFWAGRSKKRRPRHSPPTAYVPPVPAEEAGGPVPDAPWSER